jgi:SAM-dependent methyltransferase
MDYPEAVMVYSDTIRVNEDGTPNTDLFDVSHGWEPYAYGEYTVMKSFEPTPHNVAYIWYAPNHLRAFRAEAYHIVGGYPELPVLDDQDLMCRLFIHGRFAHIKKPLYKQRIHSNNSQSDPERNAVIQSATVQLYDQYIEQMALAWSHRKDLHALDLGAAHNATPGFDGVDLNDGPNVKYVGDFLELDLPPHSVGVIRAYDFLEHIADKQAVMEKIYLLLAPGGMLLSMTPSTDGRGAFQDPTHVAFWNENSFWYYTNKAYWDFAPSKTAFQVSRLITLFPTPWHREHNISYVRANLIAVCDNVHKHGGHKLI